MKSLSSFWSLHRHGLVRTATAKPMVYLADPSANVTGMISLAEEAARGGADLIVYPELCISGYSIEDLHLQQALQDACEREVLRFAEATAALQVVSVVGLPVPHAGRLYNCAAVVSRGDILGIVPKSFIPNYREFYEKRWFASGASHRGGAVTIGERSVPFGVDLLFSATNLRDFVFHVEICEDLWSPAPPSTTGALAGATVLCNLSASNITVGKADGRSLLCASQSSRCSAAYIYSAAGAGESTTDVAWDGQSVVYELGEEIARSTRFARTPQLLFADVDVNRMVLERMRSGTFNDAAVAHPGTDGAFRRIEFEVGEHEPATRLHRKIRRFPFVPNRPERLEQDCYEAFNIQMDGLAQRMQAIRAKHIVIGVSGGLDSTHALIVAAKTCDMLQLPRSTILAYTMPGFATSDATKENAWALMRSLGVTAGEIDITPAARQMLRDIGHPFGVDGTPVYDITFENVQAGLRTDYLFRLANHNDGFVLGTGDLSEIALGWATYGVGDQMSHYAVNAGVPKTLIQYLIRWTVDTAQFDAHTGEILTTIVEQEISPELVPADGSEMQSTEQRLGPYSLTDFFLYYTLREGQTPSKIAFLASHAWRDIDQGSWPSGFPDEKKQSYELSTIRHWLGSFLHRFFVTSQFKRSAIPNGPKVLAGGSLSPRGDWRAPSDSTAGAWLADLDNVPLL